MLTQVLNRLAARTALPSALVPAAPRPAPSPDAGFDALPRLAQLAADLAAAVPERTQRHWGEPAVFFFDTRRQAELEAARPAVPVADPFEELAPRITAEVAALCASPEVRRVARAAPGLREAALALAPACAAARHLAELLAVPDDEVVTVLHPANRTGFRCVVRGVADAGQFHLLMLDAAADLLPGPRLMQRFVAACRDANPTSAAGVTMLAEARFQMYAAGALRPGGTLPDGFGGSDHWLWPHTPLAAVPAVGGERVVLLGPPAYRATWEVARRFPALPAEVRLIETLDPARVAERLAALRTG
jgi:hypothetical protein